MVEGRGYVISRVFLTLILAGNVVKDNLPTYWKSGLFMVRLL